MAEARLPTRLRGFFNQRWLVMSFCWSTEDPNKITIQNSSELGALFLKGKATFKNVSQKPSVFTGVPTISTEAAKYGRLWIPYPH